MKNWINKNYKALIIGAFLIPIIIVAIVSISHVTIWYGLSNPLTWSIYLSVGIEIAALSSLAAISANMGRKVYLPFAIVTLIQFIGNIFFAYQFIDVQSKTFQDWVELVTPFLSILGVEDGDLISHKRYLALFAGGLLPLISLSFLHMLVKFTEEERLKQQKIAEDEYKKMIDENLIEEEIQKRHLVQAEETVAASDLVGEISKVRLTDEDLEKLENILLKRPEAQPSVEQVNVIEEEEISSVEQPEEVIEEESPVEQLHDVLEEVYAEKEEPPVEQFNETIAPIEEKKEEIVEADYDFDKEEIMVEEEYSSNFYEEQKKNNEEVEKFLEQNVEIDDVENPVDEPDKQETQNEIVDSSKIDEAKKKILLKRAKLYYDSLKSGGTRIIEFGRNAGTNFGSF